MSGNDACVSAYLRRPLRSYAEAIAERQRRRAFDRTTPLASGNAAALKTLDSKARRLDRTRTSGVEP